MTQDRHHQPTAELASASGRSRLSGRTAIVAGGGSNGAGIGNGRAAAIVLAREGASVLVVDRDVEAAAQTVQMIGAEGGVASGCAADVTVDADCERAAAEAAGRYGSLDILINNVGLVGRMGSVVDVDLDEWDMLMRVNVKSMMLMSRHAIPRMTSGGSIVNIASIAGIRASERALYSASKSAIFGLTTTMAGQHGRDGIRVNAVCPGAVWTPLVENLTGESEMSTLRESRRAGNMLGREGTGWDVGYAILFFASDESRWITGQALVVDGGMTKQ
jgi:NAD(P)-dependent dehydrogenase (short-subunit alcohol dehydrogenase family)